MKIIILSITPVKEKDGIITGINENGLISISVRGMFSEKSKNKPLNVPLTIADVDLEEGKYKYPLLKSWSMVYSPLVNNPTLEYLTVINILLEATKSLLPDEDKHLMFNSLENAINALKNAKEVYLVALMFLNHVLKVAGYDFEVDNCVSCGSKKNITTFSFIDGGFLCKDCTDSGAVYDLSVPQMRLLRIVYKCPDFNLLNKVETNKDDIVALLNRYYSYIFDNFGVSLTSFKTLA